MRTDPRIDKADGYSCRDVTCGSRGQQIGEYGSIVPVTMAVGARLVFPGVAPKCRGADDHARRMRDRRFSAAGIHQDRAIIARAQTPQGEVLRAELIDARFQSLQFAADEIYIDMIKRAGARRGAEMYLAAGITPPSGDPGG